MIMNSRALHRPAGRIFCLLLILAASLPAFADPNKALISDVLYRADGQPAQGTLSIAWPSFSTAHGEAVAAGSLTTNIGPGGAVSLSLVPNAGSTPGGTYYRVTIILDTGASAVEFWSVPDVATTTIAAVRAPVAPSSAAQSVTREYVDTAIAATVHLAGDETISGIKSFSTSPTAPRPNAANEVATKSYVDSVAGSGGTGGGSDGADWGSPGAIGSVTPNSAVFTTLSARSFDNERHASAFTGSDAGAKIAAAIADCPAVGCRVHVDTQGGAISSDIFGSLAQPVKLVMSAGTLSFPSVDITIPRNVELEFEQGAQWSIPSGHKVTVLSAISAPLAQIFTGPGAVTLAGQREIFPHWYGVTGAGYPTDDAPAAQAAANANPGKHMVWPKMRTAPCSGPGNGGGCVGTSDYYFASQVKLSGNSVWWSGDASAGWGDGSVQINCNANLSVACIWASNWLTMSARLENLYFVSGGTSSCSLAPNTIPSYNYGGLTGPGPDGILVSGGHAELYNVAAACFARHGIAIIGDCSLGEGGCGQPDFWYAKKVWADGNRGYGFFVNGGDGNAGIGESIQTYANMYGGISDQSALHNIFIGPGSHADRVGSFAAGANSNIASISCTASTVNVVTSSAVSGMTANGYWIDVAGTTNYNGTFKVSSWTDASHFSYPAPGGCPASENAGAIKTASSDDITARVNAALNPSGAGIYAMQSKNGSVFLDPYVELTSAPSLFGTNSLVTGRCGNLTDPSTQNFLCLGGNGNLTEPGGLGIYSSSDAMDHNFNLQAGTGVDKNINLRFLGKSSSGNVIRGLFSSLSNGDSYWTLGALNGGPQIYMTHAGTTEIDAASGSGITLNRYNAGGTTTGVIFYNGNAGVVGSVDGSGNFNGRSFASTAVTGAQPYATASTTLNTNLNADLLDGHHAADFEQPANKGSANGYASLDATAKIPTAQLPTTDRTRVATFVLGADNAAAALQDDDDQASIFRAPVALHIIEIWCQSDAGSPTINLLKNTGTTAAISTANLACNNSHTGALSTSFNSGTDALSPGDTIDFSMVSAGGTAKRVSVAIKYTVD